MTECNRNCDCVGPCKMGLDNGPATPTPQAQAGDRMADMAEHGMASWCATPPPQAPARDAGAVAWEWEWIGDDPPAPNMIRGVSDMGTPDKPAHPKHWRAVRPLIYGVTHPAAASDDAIQRAARELPEGWVITIGVEAGAGWVDLHDPLNREVEYDRDEKTIAQSIHAAIDAALSSPDGLRKGEE